MEEDPSAVFLEMSRFWVQRVLVPLMVLVGVGGNLVTIMVLTRRRMRCSTNVYLSALAVADLIYLFFVFVLSFKHYPDIHDKKYELFWRFYGISLWLCDAASSTSVWLTVSFTLERYIAVCHPIKGKVICTERRAKRVIAVIGILCVLATASTSFEHELDFKEYCMETPCNGTSKLVSSPLGSPKHMTSPSIESQAMIDNSHNKHDMQNNAQFLTSIHQTKADLATDDSVDGKQQTLLSSLEADNKTIAKAFTKTANPVRNSLNASAENIVQIDTGQNITYADLDNFTDTNITCCEKKYEIFTGPSHLGRNEHYLTFMHWFSSVSFVFLPLALIATFNCFLVHAVRKSQKERKHMTNSQENSTQSQENRITVILIGVVVLFLICQTPTAFMLIYTTFYKSTNILKGLGNIFNLLMTINAACNFILYCVLSKKYRRTFKEFFFKRKLNRHDTYAVSRTSTNRRNNSQRNGFKRAPASYSHTPRNLEDSTLLQISDSGETEQLSTPGTYPLTCPTWETLLVNKLPTK